MSYDPCASGQRDSLFKDVNDNTIRSGQNEQDIIEIKEEQTQQNINIQQNTEAINEITGSIEVKAYLTVLLNGVGISLVAGVPTALSFDKGIETNPEALSYNELTNIFNATTGIIYSEERYIFGLALTGADTNVTIEIIDALTSDVLFSEVIVVPAGSNGYQIRIPNLIEITDASIDYRVRATADRTIQLLTTDVIIEKSLTNTIETVNIGLNTPATETPDGDKTTQQEANKEFTTILNSLMPYLAFDYSSKKLNLTTLMQYGDTLNLDVNLNDYQYIEIYFNHGLDSSKQIAVKGIIRSTEIVISAEFMNSAGTTIYASNSLIQMNTSLNTLTYAFCEKTTRAVGSLTPASYLSNVVAINCITRILLYK